MMTCRFRMQTGWHCQLVCLLLALAILTSPGYADEEWEAATRPQFRQFVQNVMPAAALEAVYKSAHPRGAAEIAVGYDYSSGAWYIAGHAGISGRDQQGRWYNGTPDKGGGSYRDAPEFADFAITDYLPGAFLRLLAQNRVEIISLERNQEGAWRITFAYPLGDRPPATIELTREGLVRKFVIGPPVGRTYHWDYPEGAQSMLVPPSSALGFRLSSYEVVEGRRPLFGDMQATAERAALARVRVEEELAASAQGFSQDDSGKWRPPARTVGAEAPLARYRLPLIIGGLIVLVVAAAHFGRRHLKWAAR
jgi:hypothetical protein